MKVRANPSKGVVVVELSAREAVAYASQLVKCAMASGSLADSERPEPPLDEDMEEREG